MPSNPTPVAWCDWCVHAPDVPATAEVTITYGPAVSTGYSTVAVCGTGAARLVASIGCDDIADVDIDPLPPVAAFLGAVA